MIEAVVSDPATLRHPWTRPQDAANKGAAPLRLCEVPGTTVSLRLCEVPGTGLKSPLHQIGTTDS